MRRVIGKATEIILLVSLYISRFFCTATLVLTNPGMQHPGLIYVSHAEYYMFGGTYWQEVWSSFFVMVGLLLVDSWLFYFLSIKHRKKVVKPFLITDLACVFLTIILWNLMSYRAHKWVLIFFWLLLHCLKRFLDYYFYARRDREKNSLLFILSKAPDGTYLTAYIVLIISFIIRFIVDDTGVNQAGCFAIAVALLFGLSVFMSRRAGRFSKSNGEENDSAPKLKNE